MLYKFICYIAACEKCPPILGSMHFLCEKDEALSFSGFFVPCRLFDFVREDVVKLNLFSLLPDH